MVPINRRQFVAASGLVAIAGCLSRGSEDDDNAGDDSIPEAFATVLDPIPTSVEDAEVRQIFATRPNPEESAGEPLIGVGGRGLGLDAEDVDRTLTGIYGEYDRTISAITGSFETDDLDVPERVAASVEDGFAMTATAEAEPWDAGIEAAEAAVDDPDVGVDAESDVQTLFEPIAEMEFVVGLVEVTSETVPDDASIDPATVEAIALGRNADVDAREETVSYVAVFADGETPDESVIEEIMRTDSEDQVSPEEVDIVTEDRRATTTFTRDLPQSRLPDNSPDVHVGIMTAENDEVSLYFSGDESVDASNLEYRIDGEQAEPPWEPDATIDPEQRYEIDVPPMTLVSVVWIDPELEDVEQPLGRTVVGSHRAFEPSYDHGANELTIEYTVDRTLSADRFEVVERPENSTNEDSTPLTEYVDTLEQGTEIVLSDVGYDEYVQIRMDVGDDTEGTSESVFWYSADPPGHFRLDRTDGDHALVYEDKEEFAADTFRVLVNGDAADAQWSDVAETLSGGERIELDVSVGDTVTVEYLGDDEPLEVFSRDVMPRAEFDFDVGESTVEITHASGDAMDAEPLAVELHPVDAGPREDAFSEYDTVEAGDSITVEYETEDDQELEAVVVLYEKRLVDYTELDEEDGSGSDSDSGSGEASDSMSSDDE